MSIQQAPGRQRRILTSAETEAISRRLKETEDDRATPTNPNIYNPDPVHSRQEDRSTRRARAVLKNGQPDTLSAGQRKKMEYQAKIDKEWMVKQMVPKSMTRLRPDPSNTDYRRGATTMARVENSVEFQEVAQRYKNAQRQLHPNDPHLANLESIRPES